MVQDETRTLGNTAVEPVENGFDRAALLSVGGIVAALGAATCCVVPLGWLNFTFTGTGVPPRQRMPVATQ
ncbi:hypothetical protein ACFFTN_27315 [Aminobacter aganoensis]|uniref:Mercury ion transport protein n=1 Tax=Aminobacter aganoensis TaxID=83264 RepID=A0A7X0FDR4_9HYPH|nr:hypothetical protein [Aminobacter aganoensis]MBB6357742.1 hypothetical protein [Aminobacter aganoensis]